MMMDGRTRTWAQQMIELAASGWNRAARQSERVRDLYAVLVFVGTGSSLWTLLFDRPHGTWGWVYEIAFVGVWVYLAHATRQEHHRVVHARGIVAALTGDE